MGRSTSHHFQHWKDEVGLYRLAMQLGELLPDTEPKQLAEMAHQQLRKKGTRVSKTQPGTGGAAPKTRQQLLREQINVFGKSHKLQKFLRPDKEVSRTTKK